MLRATAKDTSDGASNAVDVTKTATATDKKDADGKPIYQIDLTAAAKSNIVTHTKACDIVLVLDRSGSMNFSWPAKTITARSASRHCKQP